LIQKYVPWNITDVELFDEIIVSVCNSKTIRFIQKREMRRLPFISILINAYINYPVFLMIERNMITVQFGHLLPAWDAP
jgi:hypothetical protein